MEILAAVWTALNLAIIWMLFTKQFNISEEDLAFFSPEKRLGWRLLKPLSWASLIAYALVFLTPT